MSYNQYNVTKEIHQISMTSARLVAPILCGTGVNCDNPFDPVAVPPERSPFLKESMLNAQGLTLYNEMPTSEVLTANTDFIETRDEQTLADALQINLRGSYKALGGGFSAEAAYREARSLITSGRTIIARIMNTKTGESLKRGSIQFEGENLAILKKIEAITDTSRRQKTFIENFGSHFVDAVQNGYRLAILGSIGSLDQAEQTEFAASFKATFGAADVSADLVKQHEATLSKGSVTIRAELVCGATEPPDIPVIFTGYSEIVNFLKALQTGAVKLRRGPIVGIARSYHAALALDFANTADALASEGPIELMSPYGVPAGTIIAWKPRDEAIYLDEGGRQVINVPKGWAVCDGSAPGVPDLRSRFIMGAEASLEIIGRIGGASAHSHAGRTRVADRNAWLASGGGDQQFVRAEYQFSLDIDPSEHMPPFAMLVYLMKL